MKVRRLDPKHIFGIKTQRSYRSEDKSRRSLPDHYTSHQNQYNSNQNTSCKNDPDVPPPGNHTYNRTNVPQWREDWGPLKIKSSTAFLILCLIVQISPTCTITYTGTITQTLPYPRRVSYPEDMPWGLRKHVHIVAWQIDLEPLGQSLIPKECSGTPWKERQGRHPETTNQPSILASIGRLIPGRAGSPNGRT